jgi:methylenetetrahydrofolate reductase (NADPH)
MIGLPAALRATPLALTAELAPMPDAASLLARAQRLRDYVDAIQITQNPGLRPLGSPLLTARLLREAGMEPVLHMNCRDRNRIALQGELLGAATAGVTALLLTRNVPMRVGRAARKHVVFDLGARQLIAAARRIRDALPAQYGLTQAPDFFIGTASTVFEAGPDWQPTSLVNKLDAGAQWVQTQLCMNLSILRGYMRRFVTAQLTHRVHVVATVAPLLSGESARRLRRNMRRALVPETLVRRVEQASDPEQTGVAICAEMLCELANVPGISGAHIIAPGDPDLIRAVIDASGLRRRSPDAILM